MPMRVYVRECTGQMWTGTPNGPGLRFEDHAVAMEIAQRSARRFAQTWGKEAIVCWFEPGEPPEEVVRYRRDGSEVFVGQWEEPATMR